MTTLSDFFSSLADSYRQHFGANQNVTPFEIFDGMMSNIASAGGDVYPYLDVESYIVVKSCSMSVYYNQYTAAPSSYDYSYTMSSVGDYTRKIYVTTTRTGCWSSVSDVLSFYARVGGGVWYAQAYAVNSGYSRVISGRVTYGLSVLESAQSNYNFISFKVNSCAVNSNVRAFESTYSYSLNRSFFSATYDFRVSNWGSASNAIPTCGLQANIDLIALKYSVPFHVDRDGNYVG